MNLTRLDVTYGLEVEFDVGRRILVVMKSGPKAVHLRLAIGLLLNAGLWLVVPDLAKWGGIEREIHLHLLAGSLAVAAFVMLIPYLWLRKPRLTPVAFLLMVLPGFALWGVAAALIKYW